jgi:hypothetical protein
MTGFLADEHELDRRSLWRLGSWGVGSIAAVVIALFVNHASIGWRQEQVASTDLIRQAQQIQWIAKESQNETRRLASAIDTLNGDRDRLYSRVTVLEQGLDSVTGSLGRPGAADPSDPPASASVTSKPAAAAATATAPASAAQTAGAAPTAELIGPPKPVAAPPPTVAQNGAPPAAAAPAKTAATATATGDKASLVATIAQDQPAAPAAAQPAASEAWPDKTNSASAAAIIAPQATAAPATAMAAPATPATPLMAAKSILAPPDPAAAKLIEAAPTTNSLPPLPPPQTVAAPGIAYLDTVATQPPAVAVQHTEFGIDLGGAISVDGLRALWRGLIKSRSGQALAELRPIIVVKERSGGLGMQLRLVAGPLSDAAAAAKICATLAESNRACETTVFDGQRLAVNGANADSSAAPAAAVTGRGAMGRSLRRRGGLAGARMEKTEKTDKVDKIVDKVEKTEEPEKPQPEKPAPAKSSLTSLLGLSH